MIWWMVMGDGSRQGPYAARPVAAPGMVAVVGLQLPDLTPRQVAAAVAIQELTAIRGYPPTLRELARHLGTGTGRAHQQVAALVDRGVVQRSDNTARGLRVVAPPAALA